MKKNLMLCALLLVVLLSGCAAEPLQTAVWIWYECVGTGSYLIYIGYA